MTANEHIKDALLLLKSSPLKLTKQRITMIKMLFKDGNSHFTAEEIYKKVNKNNSKVSLATVYNCLNQFRNSGIIKVVKLSSDKIYFDTNLKEHHHFFCQKSGKLIDIQKEQVKIAKLPKLPKGKKLESVEVIINING